MTTIAKPPQTSSVVPDRDAALVVQVREALDRTGDLRFLRVGVSAHEGLVTLKGRVSSYYAKQLAQSAAMRLDGVEALKNEIVVC